MLNQNPMMMLQKFNEFRSNFQGDPKQAFFNEVKRQNLSQKDLDAIQNTARQFQQMIGMLNKR